MFKLKHTQVTNNYYEFELYIETYYTTISTVTARVNFGDGTGATAMYDPAGGSSFVQMQFANSYSSGTYSPYVEYIDLYCVDGSVYHILAQLPINPITIR